MNTSTVDVDPLSSYEQYNTYPPYHPPTSIPSTQPLPLSQPTIPLSQPTMPLSLPNIPLTQPSVPLTQPNFPTQPMIPYNKDYYPNLPFNPNGNAILHQPDMSNQLYHYTGLYNASVSGIEAPEQAQEIEEEDIKPDISKINLKRTKKPKGKISSYWNKKITDKDFKFFGCSICNVSYLELSELDAHVTVHSNRITSYDIRIHNQKRKKQLKKEKRKRKKDAKVKRETEIYIKPEEGYIGTEVAEISQAQSVDNKSVESKTATVKSKKKTAVKCGNGKNEVYKCFACYRQFALSYYLKIHVRSHTDEKPYICNYCGQTFITASKLGRHNKRIHLAIRHQCRICFRFFNRFELLTKHFDKKHAEQKLEGEPYDYNAILPYLTELEEQFKMEAETKKPKTEDPWDPWTHETPKETLDLPKIEEPKLEMEEKETIPAKFEFADDMVKEKIEEVEIKYEPAEVEEPEVASEVLPEGVNNTIYHHDAIDHHDCSDNEPVKEERPPPTDDEDEYFPPGGWARSPPPDSPPQPPSPSVRRKGGTGVCELCNRSFSSNSYLKVHMRTHTGEKPFSCYVCGRGFITASKMHRHVLTHDKTWVGEDIKPENGVIKSEIEDDGTIIEKKPKKSKSKIEKAKIKFLKKPKMILNAGVKKGRGRPNCCEYCGKKFLHIETLQVHKKSHEGEELIYKCHFCLEPQLDQDSKIEHEATHTGPKPYFCTLCGRHYKERGAMVYHRKNHKPSDEKLFICDICSKRFNSQAKLARHIMTHSSEKFVLRYECPVCANMFHTRWHMQMHLKSHQKEGLILEENRNAVLAMVLQNARKIPKSSNPLPTTELPPPVSHHLPLPLPNPEERSRICNICGQVFQHFFYLEEHLKTHGNKIAVEDFDKEEEKKYTCQVCSKSFKLHYYLKLHSFTHTKEKPFICQQCGKGFITKGKLKRHLETHQGLKKYQCHICCKFFTRPSYMRIHVRTIHGTQDYNFRDYGVGVPVGLGGPLGPITDNI